MVNLLNLLHTFVVEDSRMVFIVGFPRSGTTWIQNEFSKLENTFTPKNETFFLTRYFNRLFHAWKLDGEDKSVNGISNLLTEQEYIEWLKTSSIELFRKIGWDGKSYFVEKTPYNIMYPNELSKLFPQSHVVLVLRKPESVYSSLLRISDLDWGSWAKQYLEPEEFCKKWNERFRHIHQFRKLFGERFHIICYESAKNNHEELSEVTNKIFDQELDTNLSGIGGIDLISQTSFQSNSKDKLDNEVSDYIKERCYPRYHKALNL